MKTIKAGRYGYQMLEWFFILSGTKFYLNWILPTNPASKNPLFKKFWTGKLVNFTPRRRIKFAYLYGGIHLVGVVPMYLVLGTFFSVPNVLINLYPIMVQIYVFIRCSRVLAIKAQIRLNHNKSTELAPAPV